MYQVWDQTLNYTSTISALVNKADNASATMLNIKGEMVSLSQAFVASKELSPFSI